MTALQIKVAGLFGKPQQKIMAILPPKTGVDGFTYIYYYNIAQQHRYH